MFRNHVTRLTHRRFGQSFGVLAKLGENIKGIDIVGAFLRRDWVKAQRRDLASCVPCGSPSPNRLNAYARKADLVRKDPASGCEACSIHSTPFASCSSTEGIIECLPTLWKTREIHHGRLRGSRIVRECGD